MFPVLARHTAVPHTPNSVFSKMIQQNQTLCTQLCDALDRRYAGAHVENGLS